MKLLIFLVILINFKSYSAEVDQFTLRHLNLADSSDYVNTKANAHLEQAITEAQHLDCNNSKEAQVTLYEILKKHFANHSKGELTQHLLHSKTLDTHRLSLNESIYRDWGVFNGYLLGRKKAAESPLALTPVIQIGKIKIGIDKLEHMFGMGYIYFNKHHLKNKKLIGVLKHGVIREKTFLGGNRFATGVFSYADLSANFNGMRFWNHMLQLNDDVLGKSQNLGPYVLCRDNKWQVNYDNPIDFRNYVDITMDESQNCSKFATKRGLKKFKNHLKLLDETYSCPMNKDIVEKASSKYKIKLNKRYEISDWIINLEGNKKLKYFNEF